MKRLLAALLLVAPSLAGAVLPVERARIIRQFPHDPGAFTEGLFWHGGFLYESTGEPGRSSIRKVDLATGAVLRRVDIPAPVFGEGIVPWRGEIVSLTWQNRIGWRWSLDSFRKLGEWRYPGEGWALTSDGTHLVMSDGTAQLRILDPATLRELRRITVTADGVPVTKLNELEYVNGEVLANIWTTDRIARIDPRHGSCEGLDRRVRAARRDRGHRSRRGRQRHRLGRNEAPLVCDRQGLAAAVRDRGAKAVIGVDLAVPRRRSC